ncbi:MAG: CSLREA domain-containing protein [Anaerolineales bacterium]|nr:CSLREA domain-containing protein [Anaerolineales bacterium]
MITKSRFLRMFGATILLLLVVFCIPTPVRADTFVVNTPDDNDDSTCDSNHCSLREAINAANNNIGPDTISFSALDATNSDITITLSTLLPPLLDDATTIDGSTIQEYQNEPLISIIKTAGTLDHAFSIQGSSCVIRAFSLAGYLNAIVVSGSGNLIENNILGWDAWNNSVGVHLAGSNNNVSGNLIVFNDIGIKITGPGQIIYGNRIGTDGSTAKPNERGIWDDGTSGGGHIIGGPNPGQRNIISGNLYDGISLRSPGTIVQGNYIGTDETGTSSMGNHSGIYLTGSEKTTIGGTSPGEGNLISGNQWGVHTHSDLTGSRIIGNIIGADVSGTYAIPNSTGIWGSGIGFITGGFNEGEGNLIFGNTYAGVRDIAEWSSYIPVIGNTITQNSYGIFQEFPFMLENYGKTYSQNSIFDNSDLGIRIDSWQNIVPSVAPPQLWNATTASVSGQACPYCIIEIFEADPDPSGAGEGKTYLTTVIADPQGLFSASFDPAGWCQSFTATSTNSRNNTSEFSQNIVGGCYQLAPPWLYPLWTFITGLFVLAGFLLRRVLPIKPGFTLIFSLLIGIAAGGGLLMLVNLHPGVIVHFTPEEQVPYTSPLPNCDSYLDPDGFSPPGNTILETLEGQFLSWKPSDDIPGRNMRWMVELIGYEAGADMQITEKTSIPLSEFSLNLSRSDRYSWQVYGEQLQPDGETWLPFCMPGERLTFQVLSDEAELEEEVEVENEVPVTVPTEEPAPTEEPEDCEATVTALQDLNCRVGPGTAFQNVGTLLTGESALVDGQNNAGTWVWILNPDALGHCWVWREGVEEVCMPDRLQIIAEPTPEPEPACRSDLSRSECGDAGGIYDPGADPPVCSCP